MADSEFYSDICIIGSGIAGLTLSHFLDPKIKINLIDKGCQKFDPNKQMDQEIFENNNYMRKNKYNSISQLGGTGNIWASRIMKLDKIDLENSNDDFNWPLSYKEIDKYYTRALDFLNIREKIYKFENKNLNQKLIYWPKDKKKFSYNSKFISDLQKKNNINLFLEHNVVSIEYSENIDHINKIICKRNGQIIKFYAKKFILCSGAIETVKLLLNSEIELNKNFKFNNIGKYYMDHPTLKTNSILLEKKYLKKYLIEHKSNNSFQIGFKHNQNEYTLNNNYSVFNFATNDKFENLEKELKMIKNFKLNINFRTILNPTLLLDYLLFFNWPYNPQSINIILNKYLKSFNNKNIYIQMSHHMEQKPNIINSLSLTNKKDRNNLRELTLNNNILDDCVYSSKVLNEKINQFFKFYDQKFELDLNTLSDASHHMGTTRMHLNPNKGSVDHDCKLNNIDNMYIMSPGVFTTGGHANPVLTLLALTIRLADKLNEKLY